MGGIVTSSLLSSSSSSSSTSLSTSSSSSISLTNEDITICRLNYTSIVNSSKNLLEYSLNNLLLTSQFSNEIEYQIFFSLLLSGITDGERSNIISHINNNIFFIISMIQIIELSFLQLKFSTYFKNEIETKIMQIIMKTNSKYQHFNYFYIILERTLKQLLLAEYTEIVHQSWSRLIQSTLGYIHPICLNYKYDTETSIPQDIEEKPNERFLTSFSNVVNLK